MDMVTVTVGWGIGGKVQCGPIQAGLLKCEDRAGLRGGALGAWESNGSDRRSPSEEVILFPGTTSFLPDDNGVKARHKDFATAKLGPFIGAFGKWGDPYPRVYFCSQVEIVAALGPSLRLGVNPGEMMDFMVGWLGVDLYEDDIHCHRDEARRLEARNWELRFSLEAKPTGTNQPNQYSE